MSERPTNTVRTALRMGARSLRRHPGLAAGFLAATVTQGVLQGALIWALREVLVAFGGSGHDAGLAVLGGASVVLGLWLLRALGVFAVDALSARLSYRVEIESMLQILHKLLALSVRFYERSSQGNLVLSSYYDLKGERTVTLTMGQLALYASQLAGLLIAAWLMSPKLALVGLVAVPLGAIPAFRLGERMTEAARRERQDVVTLHDSFLQASVGFKTIKVSRGQRQFLARARRLGEDLRRQVVRQADTRGLARLLLEAASGIGLVLVLVLGARDVSAGTMQWQSLLGLLFAVMAVYSPLIGLMQLHNVVRGVIPNLDRIDAILAAEPEVGDRPGARALREAPALIELRDVSYAYDGEPALREVSFTVRRGETIGVVGPSGAGKSTLLSLLLRFMDPTSGAVLFDGVDLRDLRLDDLMERSAIVLQEPFLFVDTVAANIRVGRPDATMDEVIAAARAANVHEEVLRMEHGYDTVVGRGEGARGISGGQRQRLCIAAALLKNAPLLFLDEATNNLDSLSEQLVQRAVERLMRGRTTFVIAHRLSTLRATDRIVVLERGQVVGLDTHTALLTTCATYRSLWQAQGGQLAEGSGRQLAFRVADA